MSLRNPTVSGGEGVVDFWKPAPRDQPIIPGVPTNRLDSGTVEHGLGRKKKGGGTALAKKALDGESGEWRALENGDRKDLRWKKAREGGGCQRLCVVGDFETRRKRGECCRSQKLWT